MDYEAVELLEQEAAERRRRRLLIWPTLMALGWLIYELTSQPNLGVVIVCAKFGWNDFRTALWLRRRDPNRRRGWACFCFYLASGLWKMAITAVVAMFAIGFLAGALEKGNQRAGPQQMPPWFPGACLTALIGFLLSTVTTLLALWLGWRHGVRFWLSPSIHRYRRRDIWPPYEVDWVPTNQGGRLLLTMLIVIAVPIVVLLTILPGLAIVRGLGPVGFGVCFVMLILAIPVALLTGVGSLKRRFIAVVPWQCWTPEDASEDPCTM